MDVVANHDDGNREEKVEALFDTLGNFSSIGNVSSDKKNTLVKNEHSGDSKSSSFT